MLFKYVWLISAKKISFIRSCYGSNKSDRLHNKCPYTSGNIKWRSFALRFCASNHKSTWQPLLPSAKGLSFIFCLLPYTRVMVIFTFPFFSFYPLASTSCWKDSDIYIYIYIYIYISNWCRASWTIIVDITLEVKGWEVNL